MILRSNFHDYYDGMLALDQDFETTFRRVKGEVEIVPEFNKKRFFGRSPAGYWIAGKKHNWAQKVDTYYTAHWIGFAGRIYPFVNINNTQYHYTDEHLKTTVFNKDIYTNFFHKEPLEYAPIFFDRYGPIFIIKWDWPSSSVATAMRNPRLLDYQFQKVVNAEQAYQQLYVYLCNQQRPAKPIPPMPNDIRIEQAGFDVKTSFRKKKDNEC